MKTRISSSVKRKVFILALMLFIAVVCAPGGIAIAQITGQPENVPEQVETGSAKLWFPLVMSRPGLTIDHAGGQFTYKNGATCATCHATQANDVFHSNHYKWDGKLGSINDFCEYPDINFIGRLTNLDGVSVNGGCATCHAGMGKKPSNPTAGVENIDCMMCHSAAYARNVVKDGSGIFVFEPAPGTVTVVKPGRAECLRCHAYSGGGDNNKRGDMSSALINPTLDQDVHMGSGMVCTDCHTVQNHKIAGRGVDLVVKENVAMKPCSDCHTAAPHTNADLNRHTSKVACQSCHIPSYGRIVSTDMLRDYRTAEPNPKRLYEPTITRGANVIPTYGFWNGQSEIYKFMQPAVAGQSMATALGGINDPASKLYPFKLHQAILPHDPVSGVILPVKSGILFQTGNVFNAIMQATVELGITLPNGYDFLQVNRTMGIYHEMPPASQALTCATCHVTNRVPFDQLGYTPKTTNSNNGKLLCESCHSRKDGWSPAEFFVKVHDQHVNEENVACSTCHNFSR
jgi:hypothetical protein